MSKDLAKSVGVDVSLVAAFIATLLPYIQAVLGIAIAIVILLINIKRLKKLEREEKEEKNKIP